MADTFTRLLEIHQDLADEANKLNPNSDRIEKMIKRHIRELAQEGGLNNKPLRSALQGECNPPDWIRCGDACVPPEVGC